jgi:hypothetical protein
MPSDIIPFMHELHNAAMFTRCVAVGLTHAIPWKLVIAPVALVFAGVITGVRRWRK